MTRSAVDTSVIVPALLESHTDHERCRVAASGAAVPAHALVEAYSVLTRLPPPHRLHPDVAHELLRRWFPADAVLVVPAVVQRSVVDLLHRAGISAGATFDGLVALTASRHDVVLVSRDVRAARTYDALGAAFNLLDD